jgi:hypothetical protein
MLESVMQAVAGAVVLLAAAVCVAGTVVAYAISPSNAGGTAVIGAFAALVLAPMGFIVLDQGLNRLRLPPPGPEP